MNFKLSRVSSLCVSGAMALGLLACGEASETSETKNGLGLTVNIYNNVEDVWPESSRYGISYCVSTAFGASHSRVVRLMKQAVDDWEAHGGFNYEHRPEHDGNCHAGNTAVTFDVRPVSGQTYLMRAFFPSYARADRNILIDSSSMDDSDQAFVGYLRHELGHTLGFRHEHINVTGGCNESGQWKPVTAYDSSSVMHYPHCKGGTGDMDNLVLTDKDKSGVASVYPTILSGFHGGCSSPNAQSNECQAAIHRFAAHKGLGTAGIAQEIGNNVFGVATFHAGYYGDISVAELRGYHAECAFPGAKSNACVSAIHRACNARGYSAGLAQEIGNQVYGVACMNAGFYGDISMAELKSKHSGCQFPNAQSNECVAAIHRACVDRGYSAGLAQEIGNQVYGVACFQASWYGDVRVRL